MGTILSYKHGEGSVKGVDPRLWDIVQHAVAASPYNAIIRSGAEQRSTHSNNHNPGWAVDVTLVDPRTGKAIPDYQHGPSFAIYEQYAQGARVYQQQKYPELNNTFRWGGYFGSKKGLKGYGAADLMHLDINPNAKGAMGQGSWANGAGKTLLAAYPGAATNGGLAGPNGSRLVAQYTQQLAGNGGLVPPAAMTADAPKPANLTRGLDQKRMEYAAQVAPPFPLSMPPSVQQARTHVASLEQPVTVPRLPAPVGMSVTPRLGQGTNAPAYDARYNNIMQAYVPEDEIAAMVNRGQKTVQPIGLSAIDMAMRDAANPVMQRPGAQAPSAPAVKVASVEPQPRFATLPTGKQIEVGRLYKIGDQVVRGEVGPDGKGTLTKVSAGMADVLFDKGIAGSVARHFAADQVRNGVKQVASGVPGVFSAFPKMASDAASTAGGFLGDLFGGKPTASLPKPTTPSYQPGMLGRGQPAQSLVSSSSNSGTYDPTGRGLSTPAPTYQPGMMGRGLPTPAPAPAPRPATQTKTITEQIMVANPDWGKVNPVAVNKLQDIHDKEDARIMAAQGLPATPPPIPQYIPKTITRTIQVPLPVAPVPAPVGQKLMARAKAMPPPLTLQGALQNWWAGTPLGSGINVIMGNKPPAQTGGGLLGAAFSMLPRQQTAMNIAAQAQRDPLGYAIGEANRRAVGPTYAVDGSNNSFNPISVQNSSRWQTGY